MRWVKPRAIRSKWDRGGAIEAESFKDAKESPGRKEGAGEKGFQGRGNSVSKGLEVGKQVDSSGTGSTTA